MYIITSFTFSIFPAFHGKTWLNCCYSGTRIAQNEERLTHETRKIFFDRRALLSFFKFKSWLESLNTLMVNPSHAQLWGRVLLNIFLAPEDMKTG